MLPIILAVLLTGSAAANDEVAGAGPWALAQALPGAPEWKSGTIEVSPDGRIGLTEDPRSRVPGTTQKRMTGLGTGFFVSSLGHVLTNNHVVAKCGLVSVENTNGDIAEGRVIAADPRLDLAVLSTRSEVPSVARFRNKRRFTPGDQASVVGFPTRKLPPLKPKRSDVVVGRYNDSGSYFEIRGDIWPGNSGGPAFDLDGLVGGVVVAKIDTPAMYEKTGKLVRDLGIVIAQSRVTEFLQRSGVPYEQAKADTVSTDKPELKGAVVRLGCWNR